MIVGTHRVEQTVEIHHYWLILNKADFAELLLDLGFSRREVGRLNFKFV
uniref:Uncharacterized protein n=1 Tax=Solanum tuberosum TaxID=4113 RepID=M1DV71_SOLTU